MGSVDESGPQRLSDVVEMLGDGTEDGVLLSEGEISRLIRSIQRLGVANLRLVEEFRATRRTLLWIVAVLTFLVMISMALQLVHVVFAVAAGASENRGRSEIYVLVPEATRRELEAIDVAW